jgi:hypothetical protein
MISAPDPFTYRAVWGLPVKSLHAFDLLVARQLLWLPHATKAVRRMLFNEDNEPVCPICGQLVATGDPAIICAAVLADRELQTKIEEDPRVIATRDPDALEAWWLVHGSCHDNLTHKRVGELNSRIELALRGGTRAN